MYLNLTICNKKKLKYFSQYITVSMIDAKRCTGRQTRPCAHDALPCRDEVRGSLTHLYFIRHRILFLFLPYI